MPCTDPLTTYESSIPPHKRIIRSRHPGKPFRAVAQFRCGQCAECRRVKARDWFIRCVHESDFHDRACFLTLTYNDKHLPEHGQLVKSDLQKFFKRLRKAGFRFQYFACGEYGSNTNRPHYHAIIFGQDFKDHVTTRPDVKFWTSKAIGTAWKKGFHQIANAEKASMRYVANYVQKKLTGDAQQKRFMSADPNSGELIPYPPEFTLASKTPAIGKRWWDQFHKDLIANDYVTIDGKQYSVPHYYDTQTRKNYPEEFVKIQLARVEKAKERTDTYTPERLNARRTINEIQLKQLRQKDQL